MATKKSTSEPPKSSRTPARAASKDLHGAADELHQQSGGTHPPLTTQQGIPVADNQNSLRATPRGPTLLEDFVLREKITHFDHERIPERIVHAPGSAAHGYFELTKSLKKFTSARGFRKSASERPLLPILDPWPVVPVRSTRRVTFAVSR